MMNSLPIKKRDPGAPMITSEIGGMSFTRSLLDTGASINILPRAVFDHHHVGVMLSRWIGEETSWTSRRCHRENRRLLFPGRFLSRRYEND